jgi:hypothetical protein
MGTKGVLYIYNKSLGTHLVLMLKSNSRTELLRIRREFMKLKSFKTKEKLIASLKSDPNIIDITESSADYLIAKKCWPFLEYSLEVSTYEGMCHGKMKLYDVLVELIHGVHHYDEKTDKKTKEPFFSPIKGQRRQDRRTSQEKAEMKRNNMAKGDKVKKILVK